MIPCKTATAMEYWLRYSKPDATDFLAHYGVKGMKWGVRRTPEELGHKPKSAVENSIDSGIIRTTVTGHKSNPRKSTPNSILDHVNTDGKVDVRSFYGPDGMKVKDIHTTDHHNPKWHKIVPHAHDYQWDDETTNPEGEARELTDIERKENDDIL